MLPTDHFCRSAIYPNCVKGDGLDKSALLAFNTVTTYIRALSIVSWDKCCAEASVHQFGIATAAIKDTRKSEREQRGLLDRERHYYLGYYSFRARNIDAGVLESSALVIRHAPEDGDDRHFHIELHALHLEGAEKAVARTLKADERLFRDKLATILFGPTPLPDEQCSHIQRELKIWALPVLPQQRTPKQ